MNDTSIEHFWADCGAKAPLALRISHPESKTEVRTFDQPFFLAGRNEHTSLWLNDSAISQHHVYFQVIAGRLYCIDVGGRTGLRWDGSQRMSGWLSEEQTLEIGPFSCQLTSLTKREDLKTPATNCEDPVWNRTDGSEHLPSVTVEVSDQLATRARWRMSRVLAFVGRSVHCKIRLEHLEVSRFHCALLRTPNGIWVVDLLSRTGVIVNNASVAFAKINDGDRIQVGQCTLRFWYDQPMPSSEPTSDGVVLDAGSSLDAEQGTPTSEENESPSWPLAEYAGPTLPPLPLETTKGDSAALFAMLEQFNTMQQQMFNQFQQTLLIMAQTFRAMHQDQLDLIQGDLERYQAVTLELLQLREELRKRTEETSPSSAEEPLSNTDTPNGERGERRDEPPTFGGKTNQSTQKSRAKLSQTQQQPAPPGSGRSKEAGSQEDIHGWLSQRIVALEQERQGRWQKIVGFMLGR